MTGTEKNALLTLRRANPLQTLAVRGLQFGLPAGLAFAVAGSGGLILMGFVYGIVGSAVLSASATPPENDLPMDPADADTNDRAAQLSRAAGLKKPARVFFARDALANRMIGGYAATMNNNLYVNRRFFQSLSDEKRDFVMAHEIAHIRAGDLTYGMSDFVAFKASILTAVIASVAGMGAIVFGAAVPVAALLAASGNAVLQLLVNSSQSRRAEYRADENAIRLTRDFNAAAAVCHRVEWDSQQIRAFVEFFYRHKVRSLPLGLDKYLETHPGYTDRVANLRRAYKRATGEDAPEWKRTAYDPPEWDPPRP